MILLPLLTTILVTSASATTASEQDSFKFFDCNILSTLDTCNKDWQC